MVSSDTDTKSISGMLRAISSWQTRVHQSCSKDNSAIFSQSLDCSKKILPSGCEVRCSKLPCLITNVFSRIQSMARYAKAKSSFEALREAARRAEVQRARDEDESMENAGTRATLRPANIVVLCILFPSGKGSRRVRRVADDQGREGSTRCRDNGNESEEAACNLSCSSLSGGRLIGNCGRSTGKRCRPEYSRLKG